MNISSYRAKKLPKTLGTKVNRITYRNFQEEAEKRSLSESQLLRVIISEIITLHPQELLIIPDSGMQGLTELSFTLGTKVPLDTYLTFCNIAKKLKITQSSLLRFGIEAEFQNDNSFIRINAKPLNTSLYAQGAQRKILINPRASMMNQSKPEMAGQTVTSANWILEIQKKASRNLLLGYQITQFADTLFL